VAAGLEANAGGYRRNADYSSLFYVNVHRKVRTRFLQRGRAQRDRRSKRREESAAAEQCAVPMSSSAC